MKPELRAWLLFCSLAGLILVCYVSTSLVVGAGAILMPLDDVYIHFQYARQLALGQPNIYNPGLEPTSGATSFLYPFLLAFGYLVGFQGLSLGLWAMILGAVALLASMWAVYRIARAQNLPDLLALSLGAALGLSGPASWHAMSGMETGIMIALLLWVLHAVQIRALRLFVVAALLLALLRPEGSLLAGVAVLAMLLRLWGRVPRRQLLYLLLPILALGLQPLANWLITGTAIASGNQSKSILGMVPRDYGIIFTRILDGWLRSLGEWFTGYSAQGIWYLPPLLMPAALLALLLMLRRAEERVIALMILIWALLSSLAIATLDTAFWHFKRYQIPLMLLAYPLLAWLPPRLWRGQRAWTLLLSGLLLASSLLLGGQFWRFYAQNLTYVRAQPQQMAEWLRDNTPESARVAVHDVGMMRYLGGRTTLDMVGLTTPGVADYWRNGPGSVAEFLLREEPDYIASYGRGHGYGLDFLAETRLFAPLLAGFSVDTDARANVALAGDFQGIYAPDWPALQAQHQPHQAEWLAYLAQATLVDSINVADMASEAAHAYDWSVRGPLRGYPTEVYDMLTLGCEADCALVDGGRLIDGAEQFTLAGLRPGEPALLLTRVHPREAGRIEIRLGDLHVAERVIPALPGHWLELAAYIPAELVTESLTFTIAPRLAESYYMPYYHWIFQGDLPPEASAAPGPAEALARYQDGAFMLVAAQQSLMDEALRLDLEWYSAGAAQGDYRLFVHLYDDTTSPPLAQSDVYTGQGALPPGNWLPGLRRDTIKISVTELPAGSYTLALGFYDPQTGERLSVDSDSLTFTTDGRLILGLVELDNDG